MEILFGILSVFVFALDLVITSIRERRRERRYFINKLKPLGEFTNNLKFFEFDLCGGITVPPTKRAKDLKEYVEKFRVGLMNIFEEMKFNSSYPEKYSKLIEKNSILIDKYRIYELLSYLDSDTILFDEEREKNAFSIMKNIYENVFYQLEPLPNKKRRLKGIN